MSRYRVVLIDDEISFINSLGRTLEEDGYPVVRLTSIREAVESLQQLIATCGDGSVPEGEVDDGCWFVVVLDHDFPREDPPLRIEGRGGSRTLTVGYDVAQWLRQHHPLGRLLPIVYLSGRETAQGFIAQMRRNGQYHPDAFITKAEIGIDVDLLLDTIEHFDHELARLYALVEEHGVERGRYVFHDIFDE
jgi:CheY-like chemotaxis protein